MGWLIAVATLRRARRRRYRRRRGRQEDVPPVIAKFKEKDPGMEKIFADAVGYAVFPTVGKGGIGIGGARGKGWVYQAGAADRAVHADPGDDRPPARRPGVQRDRLLPDPAGARQLQAWPPQARRAGVGHRAHRAGLGRPGLPQRVARPWRRAGSRVRGRPSTRPQVSRSEARAPPTAPDRSRRPLHARPRPRPRRHGQRGAGARPPATTSRSRSRCSTPSWPPPSAPTASSARSGSPPASSTPTSSASSTRARRPAASSGSPCRSSRARTPTSGCSGSSSIRPTRRSGSSRRPRARCDYAHEQGVVHRDIKPDNILLSGDEVLVADFGVARAVSEVAQKLTATGMLVGTPTYMSPEQATGDKALDGRSRHLRAGLRAVRDAGRRAAVQGPEPAGDADAPVHGAAPAAPADGADAGARRGGDHARAGEGAGRSVRHGAGVRRRAGGARGGTGGPACRAAGARSRRRDAGRAGREEGLRGRGAADGLAGGAMAGLLRWVL